MKIYAQRREIGRARQHIVHQRSRNQLTVIVIGNPFQQDLPDSLCYPTVNLTMHDERIDNGSNVVNGAIGNDVHLSGVRIDLDFAHVTAIRMMKTGGRDSPVESSVVGRSGGRSRRDPTRMARSSHPIEISVPRTQNDPSRNSTSALLTSRTCDASDRPFSTTSSPAIAIADPAMIIDREPTLARPFGKSELSFSFMRTLSNGTPRRSETSCAKLVSCPWPDDWVAVTTITVPFASKRMSAPSYG